ncbi:hypothetical protein [Methylophilus sp. Leaf408]|uniref:hypothetical protein n=1 Tax=Methylophilus sp. Leaf408 TaxID=2876561 RepID=UPI001E5A4741|nr:hypothetical protein [Methylophilus sp. Leaf408]
MFKLKKWLWTQWQNLRGTDRAYARYLSHFHRYQAQAADNELQQSLNLKPMSRQAFEQAWQKKTLKPTGKSCGCKPGGSC